jgi:hypothetical protein
MHSAANALLRFAAGSHEHPSYLVLELKGEGVFGFFGLLPPHGHLHSLRSAQRGRWLGSALAFRFDILGLRGLVRPRTKSDPTLQPPSLNGKRSSKETVGAIHIIVRWGYALAVRTCGLTLTEEEERDTTLAGSFLMRW